MGHEVRNHKLQHLHHKHRHSVHEHNRRDNPAPYADPPIALPYFAAAPPQLPSSSNYSLVPYPNSMPVQAFDHQQQQLNQALADVRRHGRNERIGEIGAAAAGAFAMYELHEAKVDPMHARRHKMEAQLAGAIALGSAGYAFHEHQEKKKSEHLVEVLSGTSRRKDNSHGKRNCAQKGESKLKWLK